MAGWFSRRRITPPELRAADALEDAAIALSDPYAHRSGRARTPSPRSVNITARRNRRDAEWAAEQAARPSLLRRASQGALELVRGTPRGALNLAQGASNLAVRASRGALNFVRRPAPAAADADNRLECSICYSNAIAGVVGDKEAVLVNCPASHRFHRGCIQQWFDLGHATCPYCRQPATPLRPVPVAHTSLIGRVSKYLWPRQPGGGGFKKKYRRTRSKSKSRRYPRKPHKTRKV